MGDNGFRTRLARFLRVEAGGATVEYVVMAAAAVGLGLATAGAVRTGVGSLGGSAGTSLSGGAVMAVAVPTGGGNQSGGGIRAGGGTTPDISYPTDILGSYSLRHYDQNTFQSLQTWVANDFRDNDLWQEYTYQVDYLTQNAADDQLSRETLDWIYVLAYEITRRGLSYPNNTLTFDQVVATYDAAIAQPVVDTQIGNTPRTPPTR